MAKGAEEVKKEETVQQIWVAIRKDEVIEILKAIEALKRKLLSVLQT